MNNESCSMIMNLYDLEYVMSNKILYAQESVIYKL